MMKFTNTFFLILIILVFSCGENVVEEPDESIYGYEYFPLEIGYTWEYQVDSVIVFQGGDSNLTSSSFIQEKVVELIGETPNEKTYKLERRYKKSIENEWLLQDVWQVSISLENAIKTEENLKFIKLVFPALPGKRWDGNSFFDSDQEISVASNNIAIYQDWSYKIEDKNLSRTIGDITYDDVLHVSHIDEESLINKRFSEEFYAAGVGLVERNMIIFDTQNPDTSLDWLDRAQKGFQLNQRLISFSTN